MKRIWLILVVLVLSMVLLAACAPVAGFQGFVQLPDGVRVGITAVIVWLVSWVFAQLILLVPFLKFLEEFKEPLALAIAAALIGWIENIVPDAYGGVAVLAIQLLLAILALFGVGQVFKKRGARFFGTWRK